MIVEQPHRHTISPEVGSERSPGALPRLPVAILDIRRTQALVLLLLGWALIGLVVGLRLSQGWMPHDDGSFAQSAHRVLEGELPHRDFAELYTGGMTFLNAAVFRVFGEDLLWLRIPAYVAFLASIPCFYFIARRFVPPVVAGVATAAGYAWGFPVYPAAVPSWYVLFFSIAGVAALLRYLDTGRRRWLFVAGLMGGLSISFKIIGVYYVLAVMVFLLFVDQTQHSGPRRRFRASDIATCAIVPLALIIVASVLRKRFGVSELVILVIPLMAVSLLAITRESSTAVASTTSRVRRRAVLLLPFVTGVLVPVGLVTAPFLVTGSLGEFMRGILITPQSRTDFTYLSLPDPARLAYALPIVAVLVLPALLPRRWAVAVVVFTTCVVTLLVGFAYSSMPAYRTVFESAREVAPLVVVIGVASILVLPVNQSRQMLRAPLFLVLSMVAFLGLVQYPFGAPVYYCYVAPLVVLAAVAVTAYVGTPAGVMATALLTVYAIFAITIMDRGALTTLGLYPGRDRHTAILDVGRASVRVTPDERDTYRRVVHLLTEHGSGRYVFAGPDAPEVYFLSGRENPTRALFDFLDDTNSARGTKLVGALVAQHVTAIAINVDPDFSTPLDAWTLRRLRSMYPATEQTGRFEIRWKALRPA
jgi:hypothetical protein